MPTRSSGRVESSSRHLEVEQRIGVEGHLQAAVDLLLDLFLGAEDVPVVLGEVAHAQKAVEHARGLVAVQQARLEVADR